MIRFGMALVLLSACGDNVLDVDAAVPPDAAPPELGPIPDGGVPLAAAFTIVGCTTLAVVAGVPYCQTSAPAQLTFVPLGSGITDFLWTFVGGVPGMSQAPSPMVRYARPGFFSVTLAAGGPAGTTVAEGRVVVDPGGLGAPCMDVAQCALLRCVCASGACPGALAAGLCSNSCGGLGGCGAGVCADLSRGGSAPVVPDGGVPDGGPPDDGGAAAEWRIALCLPACVQATDCRAGFLCREVPVLDPGASAGGPYGWSKACFNDWPGDVGDSCLDPDGTPSPGRCLSGRCDPYGARGLCTADCTTVACPSYASCATLNGSPGAPLCLRRCDAAHPCADPLLACEAPGAAGTLGFSVPPGDPPGTTYCAPRRCALPSDCAPSGMCRSLAGGMFCMKS